MRAVWRNEIGGVTWQIGEGPDREFVKIGPAHVEYDPARDAARHTWAAQHIEVPLVLGVGEGPDGLYLHTRGLPGVTAVLPSLREQARTIIPRLGAALRRWHDTLPVADCPFTWAVPDRGATFAPPRAAGFAAVPPPHLVVSPRDTCSPNFLLDPDTLTLTGYVDLGQLGVADRYADLAPAILSLSWNYETVVPDVAEQRGLFCSGYGLDLDEGKLDFYVRLWNAGC